MKKEFYIGQPLIIKNTGEKVTFAYDDGDNEKPCVALINGKHLRHEYYNYEELEPSTEFKFSEIIAGLEQGYFEVGTEFQSEYRTLVVGETIEGLGLVDIVRNPISVEVKVNAGSINKNWTLVEPRKEMTLEEIEAELGYKIKLKDKRD